MEHELITDNDIIKPEPLIQAPVHTPTQKILRALGWISLAVACLVFFLFIKVPDTKIKQLIQQQINQALAMQGMQMSSRDSSLSLIFGPKYTLVGASLNFQKSNQNIHFDEITVTPKIIALLTGKMGAQIEVTQGKGELELDFTSSNQNDISVSFDLDQIKLSDFKLLDLAAGLKGDSIVNGSGSFSGNLLKTETMKGDIRLQLTQTDLPSQTFYGFNIPAIKISESKIDVQIKDGKAQIKRGLIGKKDSKDDLVAELSGAVTLSPRWQSSSLDLKAKFWLSENIRKSFALLEALMASAKQSDGSFAYSLTGLLTAPIPTPQSGG